MPKKYSLERETASKDYNYYIDFSKNDILRTDTSFNDTIIYSSSGENPAPRIYRYTLNSKY